MNQRACMVYSRYGGRSQCYSHRVRSRRANMCSPSDQCNPATVARIVRQPSIRGWSQPFCETWQSSRSGPVELFDEILRVKNRPSRICGRYDPADRIDLLFWQPCCRKRDSEIRKRPAEVLLRFCNKSRSKSNPFFTRPQLVNDPVPFRCEVWKICFEFRWTQWPASASSGPAVPAKESENTPDGPS
jgi:hypothetical protein